MCDIAALKPFMDAKIARVCWPLSAVAVMVAACAGGQLPEDGETPSTEVDAATEAQPDTGSFAEVKTKPRCGDGTCNAAETCTSCPRDCGECPKCELAPTCTGAEAVPSKTLAASHLNLGSLVAVPAPPPADAAAAGCLDPQLRLRVKAITVNNGGGELYCIVNASDGVTSEVAMTTKTRKLGDDDTHSFEPTVGSFWGGKVLHPTVNNLTITYNCFEVKGDDWAKVLKAVGDAAGGASSSAGAYGWVFGLGSVAANAAAAGVAAAAGDGLKFNAQQTIDRQQLLALTNGRYWKVRQAGGGVFSKFDWTLTIESWGCAEGVPRPR
jgi:hypothetical protein